MLPDKHRQGLTSELLAKTYFIDQGYMVYSAENGLGPIDFILVKENEEPIHVDVKTFSTRSDGTKICRTGKKLKGFIIKIVYVDLKTKEVSFNMRDTTQFHKKYKQIRNEKGHFTGKFLEKNDSL